MYIFSSLFLKHIHIHMTDNNVYLKGTGVLNDGGKNAKLDLHRGKLFPPLLLKGKKITLIVY